MLSVKCVTMQKDEVDLLSPWLRYHGDLFGFDNLVVIDNGSTVKAVVETLEMYERVGVKVYRQFSTSEHYHQKGPITADVIRILDNQFDYDFVIPLDCDEFLALWQPDGVTCDRRIIHEYLESLPADSTHFRIGTCLYNDPGRPGWFWPQTALKGLMRKRSIISLDHGCHMFSDDPNFEMAPCALTHLHLHHKPFKTLQEHSRWKLKGFVDVEDQVALRNFKGPGTHLIRNLLSTEAEYHRQFQDHITFRFLGFSLMMSALGFNNKMFTLPKMPGNVSQYIPVRLPRNFAGNLPEDVGDTIELDPLAYRDANFDVAAAGENPLRHFLYSGYQESRALE